MSSTEPKGQDEKQQNTGNQSRTAHTSGGQSDSGGAGAQRQRESEESTAAGAYKNETGDPGRTPGSAEGVENFEETGNE